MEPNSNLFIALSLRCFDQIEEVDRMKKIWLPVGAYEQLERIAKERGATPDEAITQIILKNVRR